MAVIYVDSSQYVAENAVLTATEVITNGANSDQSLLLTAEASALASKQASDTLLQGGLIAGMMLGGA